MGETRWKAQRHLTLLMDAVTSHRKMPPCQDSIDSIGKFDNKSHKNGIVNGTVNETVKQIVEFSLSDVHRRFPVYYA